MKNFVIRKFVQFFLVFLILFVNFVPLVQAETLNRIEVKLDSKSLTLKIGDQEQLTATLNSIDSDQEEDFRWSSDNKGIAEVDEYGLVTAKKAGKAKIYATSLLSKKTAYCLVTVLANVKVSGVVLDTKTLKLQSGLEDQLVATVKPSDATNQNVTWSSSNKGIVEVDEDGNLYGKRVGKAKITATTEDGKKPQFAI